jgi:hypothetical protein
LPIGENPSRQREVFTKNQRKEGFQKGNKHNKKKRCQDQAATENTNESNDNTNSTNNNSNSNDATCEKKEKWKKRKLNQHEPHDKRQHVRQQQQNAANRTIIGYPVKMDNQPANQNQLSNNIESQNPNTNNNFGSNNNNLFNHNFNTNAPQYPAAYPQQQHNVSPAFNQQQQFSYSQPLLPPPIYHAMQGYPTHPNFTQSQQQFQAPPFSSSFANSSNYPQYPIPPQQIPGMAESHNNQNKLPLPSFVPSASHSHPRAGQHQPHGAQTAEELRRKIKMMNNYT